MTEIRLDHVSVTCADLDRSLAFYVGVLGLPLAGRGESKDAELSTLTGLPGVRVRWAEVALGGGQLLELLRYVTPEGAPVRPATNDPGATHIGLSVEDLGAFHRRLVEAGVPVRSQPVELREQGAWTGVRCLYTQDPDGVAIELVERARVVTLPETETAATEPA